MRCPECQTENEEGAAICEMCAEPLTAYSGATAGYASEATLAKLRHLRTRPPVSVAMAVFLAAVALIGPLRIALAAFTARPQTNAEGTNYIGSAFGAVGAFLSAIIWIPAGLAILIVVWGVLFQRTWAWTAALAVAGIVAITAMIGLTGGSVTRLIIAAICGALIFFWFRPEIREWYGA